MHTVVCKLCTHFLIFCYFFVHLGENLAVVFKFVPYTWKGFPFFPRQKFKPRLNRPPMTDAISCWTNPITLPKPATGISDKQKNKVKNITLCRVKSSVYSYCEALQYRQDRVICSIHASALLPITIREHTSLIIIIIIIIINRQFLTRRNMEPHHPLQGRELSMCREIQCCFDMSIVTVKQMSLESVFERSQRLQISDVWWQLVPLRSCV